jgi:hypothetical protein
LAGKQPGKQRRVKKAGQSCLGARRIPENVRSYDINDLTTKFDLLRESEVVRRISSRGSTAPGTSAGCALLGNRRARAGHPCAHNTRAS